jgi:tetratricopeptide (TPR) repeat protein
MDAWDHYLRGMWHFHQFSPTDSVQAERLMRRAIEIDPTFAQAHMGLARILSNRVLFEWSDDIDANLRASYESARRAVELDDRDPYAHYILAWPCLLMREHEESVAAVQRAIDLTPNFALAYFMLGVIRVFLGRFEQASDPFQRAIRLSPREPLTFFFANHRALAQYHLQRYEDAAKIVRMAIGVRPTHMLYRTLAACYGQLGRAEEARAALAELRRLMPNDAERHWEVTNPYLDAAHRDDFIDGLRKAGWSG